MRSFSLIPKSTLDLIAEKLNFSFQSWADEWSVCNDSDISICASNAFEQQQCDIDLFYEYDTPAGYVYLSSKNMITHFFGCFILNNEFSNISNTLDNSENEICQYVVNASVDDYFNRVFSAATTHNIDEVEDDNSSLFRRGSGAVHVSFSYGDFKVEFLLPKNTCQELVPINNYKQQVSDFGKIDVTKLDNKISVSATLNKTKLNVKDLMGLSNGDYLVLEHKVNDEVNLLKDEQLIAKCCLGVNEHNKAIQIIN